MSLNVMKCPPKSLFISSLYPACFLHFDFSSLCCPALCFPSKICFVLLMYILEMHGKHFMLIAPLLPGFPDLCLCRLSLSPSNFLFPQLVRELLHEGQALSVGVSAESGRGGQWLARIRQLIKEGSVPDVSLVPVGISYDCVPKTKNIQVDQCKHTLASTHIHHLIKAICNVLRSK